MKPNGGATKQDCALIPSKMPQPSRLRFGLDHKLEACATLGLGVPGVVKVDPFGKEAFPAALAAAGQGGAAGFGGHASAKAVLPFTGPFGRLVGAFHNNRERRKGSAYRRRLGGLVNDGALPILDTDRNCQELFFLK